MSFCADAPGNLEQVSIGSLDMSLSMAQPITEIVGSEARRQRFSALAREYYEPVYCFIARQVSSQADAADLTQQVFIKGFQSFDRFDLDRAFAPWIYTIARRTLVDFFRSSKPSAELVDEAIADPQSNPRQATIRKDGADTIWRFASELKPQYQQVLLLHYKENFSMQEVARIMGVTKTHAKVLVFRARAALKKRMQAANFKLGEEQ